MIIKIDDIKVSQRLRELDNSKVYDLMESIQLIGLLQPIVVDSECNLLAGMHRLEAIRTLGHDTIECNQINLSELEKDLVEVEENLVRHDLNVIEKSEHIILRESILESLGRRASIKDNQFTLNDSVEIDIISTTSDLAKELGVSKRNYQRIKQIYGISHTAREKLKETSISSNLDALLLIERLRDDDIQLEIANRITSGDTRNIRRLIKDIKNENKRDELAQQVENYKNSNHKKLQLYHGDFREVGFNIEDDSVDMIFADLPYITDDALDLYEGLSELGSRVLKDGASCLCYVTQSMVHDVLSVMSQYLNYYWIIAIKHGGNIGRHGRGIFVEWKPIVWFVKGDRKRDEFVADFVYSERTEKMFHEWEQSIKEAEYYITHLSNVGDTILDATLGSGTTGVAAVTCSRNFIGIEKDKRTFDIATTRINTFLGDLDV